MWGYKNVTILKTEKEGAVRLLEDTITGTYSIGLKTDTKSDWKDISEELHDLLIKEVSDIDVVSYKFRIQAEKIKCLSCDLIFLVEERHETPSRKYTCPSCGKKEFVESMEIINVVEEN